MSEAQIGRTFRENCVVGTVMARDGSVWDGIHKEGKTNLVVLNGKRYRQLLKTNPISYARQHCHRNFLLHENAPPHRARIV